MRGNRLLIALAAICGIVFAVVNHASAGGTQFTIEFGPPASPTQSKLVSGWHYSGAGPALDWAPLDGQPTAYMRVWAYRHSGGATSTLHAFPYAEINSANCTTTVVDFLRKIHLAMAIMVDRSILSM